jgi:hypothetical protein
MLANLDVAWWEAYRRQLEHQFEQDVVLIRVTRCQVI